MPGGPSFYFTLFKKFQVLNHVPGATLHGTPGGAGGFTLTDPNAANGVFGASNSGNPLTIPDAVTLGGRSYPRPCNSPL